MKNEIFHKIDIVKRHCSSSFSFNLKSGIQSHRKLYLQIDRWKLYNLFSRKQSREYFQKFVDGSFVLLTAKFSSTR